MNNQLKQRLEACLRLPESYTHAMMEDLLSDCRTALEERDAALTGADARIHVQEKRIEEQEAALAQMRAVIEMVKGCGIHSWEIHSCCCFMEMEKALSTDAGKAFLERLQKAEKERDRYRSALERIESMGKTTGFSRLACSSSASKALQPKDAK